MESHCMLTRSQTKSNSGEDKLKTHQTPDKTGTCHMLIKKTESVKNNVLIASSEEKLKRKTSSPKQSIASDLVVSKPLDRLSSKHNSTTVETSTMSNVTTDKEAEMCKTGINQQTEMVNIPKKRKWIEENEGNTSDKVSEESKTLDNRIDTENNKELIKNKPYILLTPVIESTEILIGTDTGFETDSMNQNGDSKNKACHSGKESAHSCEELENSSITGSSEPQISRKSCTPYNLRRKKDEVVIEKSYVNNFESRLGSNVGKVSHEETDSAFNELHEKDVTHNSVKCKHLGDKIESKVIIEHISPVKKDTEKTGEDITCQNKFKVDNALNKVDCHIQITDDFRKYGIGSCEEEKPENLIDSVQMIDTHQTCETELSENRKQGELADTMHITENYKKIEFTQEKLIDDVSALDTHKKIVNESCEDEKKESFGVTHVADGHRKCGVGTHEEENQERQVNDIQLLDRHRNVWIELSEGKKLETSLSLSENIVNTENRDGHSKKNVNQNKLLSEDSGQSLLESEFQKLQKEKLHSGNETSISAGKVTQREVNTKIWGNGISDVAACGIENSETSELLNESDPEMQGTQSSSGEGCKRNNEESYSSIKLANVNTDDSVSPSTNQTNIKQISLLEEKCIKNSEEESSSISLPTNTLSSKSIETSSSTDHGKCAVSNKDFKNSEGVSNSELQLKIIDTESQMHMSEVCSNKQCIPASDNTCNRLCYSVTEQENSADDSNHDKNKKTGADKMNKCCLEKWKTVQVNVDSAVREQKHISLCEEDSSENISVKYKSVTEVSNELNNQSQHTLDSPFTVESNQWFDDHNTKTVSEEQSDLFCYKSNNNIKNKKKKLNLFDLDKGSVSNNVGEKVLFGGNHTKLSCSSSSSDVVIEEDKDVSFKQYSKLFCNSKQSSDNSNFTERGLSQTTSADHGKFQKKLLTCDQQAQENNCLLAINAECPKPGNSVFKNLTNESGISFQTSESHHYNPNNFLSNKTMYHCHEECMYNCACNKIISNHCNVCKQSENMIVSCVIPSVVSTVDNYFHTVGLKGRHVQTLKEQIRKNIRSVIETVQHTSRMHVLPDTPFINKKRKNGKKKNKGKKKNESLNMHLKEGENQYLKKSEEQEEGQGNIMKETENNQYTEHERKKINMKHELKLKHEINKYAKARSKQIKNTASDQVFKSVPHDVLRLSGKEKAQTARSKQMEQLRLVKVMKEEKRMTSGKNVFSVCRSDNISKDKKRRKYAESLKKGRKVKHKFRVETVNEPKDNHGSYRQPTFQKNNSFTVCGSDNIRKDTMKPEYGESFKKVNEVQHKFTDETIKVPKDKHALSCKPMMFQKGRVFPVCGNNNIMDETDKLETKKDAGLKHKFSVKTCNEGEGKLKSSSGEFTFQLGSKTAYEKGILEPIRPHDNKSKEYLSALQEMKWNQASTSGLNIFSGSTKSKISGDKAVGNKGASSTNVENRESLVKRLPEELLEAVSQNVLEKNGNKSKQGVSKLHIKSAKHKKKLKLKSAVLEDGYIPLNTNSATQFVVARLDKKTTLSAAKKAAQFKQNCLYGPHIKRAPVKREYVMQKLCPADDHH